MKIPFTLEYYLCNGGTAEISLHFLFLDYQPITILRMNRFYDEDRDDPLEYLKSYSSDELKAFWEQFKKYDLHELLVTEGITVCFEFSKNSTSEIGSPENTNTNPLITFNLNSLV